MRFFIALCAVFLFLVPAISVAEITPQQEIAQLKKIQKQELVQAIITAKKQCGTDKVCKKQMIQNHFINRIQKTRVGRRVCQNEVQERKQICVLEHVLENTSSYDSYEKKEVPVVTEEKKSEPEEKITAAEKKKFNTLFARHRTAWGNTLAALLPDDLPKITYQKTHAQFDFHMKDGADSADVSLDSTTKIDLKNHRILSELALDADFSEGESFTLEGEIRMLAKTLYARLNSFVMEEGELPYLPVPLGQWVHVNMQKVDPNFDMKEILAQQYPQKNIRQFFANTIYFVPVEYHGKSNNREVFTVKLDTKKIFAGFVKHINKSGMPADDARMIIADLEKELSKAKFSGKLEFDAGNPKYFVFEGGVTESDEEVLHISADVQKNKKNITISAEQENVAVILDIAHPNTKTSNVQFSFKENNDVITEIVSTVSTTGFDVEVITNDEVILDADFEKNRSNIWSGKMLISDMNDVIEVIINRFKWASTMGEIDMSVYTAENEGVEITGEWKTTSLKSLQINAPEGSVELGQ